MGRARPDPGPPRSQEGVDQLVVETLARPPADEGTPAERDAMLRRLAQGAHVRPDLSFEETRKSYRLMVRGCGPRSPCAGAGSAAPGLVCRAGPSQRVPRAEFADFERVEQ